MKLSESELLNKTEEAFQSCLEGVPFAVIRQVTREGGKSGPDLLAEITLPDRSQRVILEAKTSGQPRLAREAVNQILRYQQSFLGAYGVFVAPYISPVAAEICIQEGIGYLDLSGNCRLCFGEIYIEKEGKPNKFAISRGLRSLYQPKAARVLRVLLNNPGRVWKVSDLAKEAQVSLGQVSNVKKILADREWVRAEESGFTIEKPESLLLEWAQNYSFRKNEMKDCYSLKAPAEIEADLAELCNRKGIRYALTGFSAAARMAPSVRYQRAFAYVDGDYLEEVISELALKEASTGANISILSPYDDGVFYGEREFEGIRTASPVQVYLDLIGFRGRGEEAARTLLEEAIRPQW